MLMPISLIKKINDINEYHKSELEKVKKDISVAKSYGDLSENTSYENAINYKHYIDDVIKSNSRFLEDIDMCEDDDEKLKTTHLFKFYKIELTDLVKETSTIIEGILSPNIEGIKPIIPMNSRLGEIITKLMSTGMTGMTDRWGNTFNSIKILEVNPYDKNLIKEEFLC